MKDPSFIKMTKSIFRNVLKTFDLVFKKVHFTFAFLNKNI